MGPRVTVKVKVRLADSTSDVSVMSPEEELHQVCAERRGFKSGTCEQTQSVGAFAFQNMVFFRPPALLTLTERNIGGGEVKGY